MKNTIPPVKVDQQLSSTITGFGSTGDPIIKVDNYVIFVKDCGKCDIGQEIEIKIIKALEKYGFAEVI